MIITITGKPCSGKSTIAKLLVDQHGFTRIGVGDIFKAEAHKRGMTTEEFNKFCMSDPSFDYVIDQQTVELGKQYEGQKYIFDSRLAWHFVPKSFKVFVDLDREVSIERLVNSDRTGKEKYSTREAAEETLANRQVLEVDRYKQIYNIDLYDLSHYDLVIDSENRTPQDLADEVWAKYQEFCKNYKG